MRSQPTMLRRLAWVVLALVALVVPARTADHRDGPRIAQNTPTLGNIDINDVYIFRSPQSNQRTVMIMTLSAAAGVIGPAQFDPNAAYEFRIDNTGDAITDVVFQVAFSEPNAEGWQRYSVRLGTSSHGQPRSGPAMRPLVSARTSRSRRPPCPTVGWWRLACSTTRSSST